MCRATGVRFQVVKPRGAESLDEECRRDEGINLRDCLSTRFPLHAKAFFCINHNLKCPLKDSFAYLFPFSLWLQPLSFILRHYLGRALPLNSISSLKLEPAAGGPSTSQSLPSPYLGLPRALAAKKPRWHVLLPLAVLIGLLGISVCSSSAWLSSAAFPVWTYSVRSTEHHSGTSDNCMRTVCRRLAQPLCRWSTECLFVFCVLSREFQSQCLEQSHLSYLLLFFVTCAVRCVSKLRNSFEKLSWKILRKPMF